MYILIIARGYPTEKYKLNGIFEFDQAKALAEAGHKVIYAALDLRSIRRWRSFGFEKKEIEGVKIYALNLPLGAVPEKLTLNIGTKGLLSLYKRIAKEEGVPDIIHSHFAQTSAIASKLKASAGCPFVVTEHLSTLLKLEIPGELFDEAKEAYSKADAIIAVSPTLGEAIKERFHKDYEYIPNIVDTETFSYEAAAPHKEFTFVSAGRLVEGKCFDMTIRAFKKAFADNSSVSLAIFGDGPERDSLEWLIKELGLTERVKLMGLRGRVQMAEYFRKSQVFVLPSRSETFGVVYIEALACGLPVLATACGGPEAFVNENNGMLIPVDNEEALTEAFKHMYESYNSFDSASIAKSTKEGFGPQAVARKLKGIYERILPSR